MSTITVPSDTTTRTSPARLPAFVVAEGGDQRTVFRGVDWHTSNQLSQATGEIRGIEADLSSSFLPEKLSVARAALARMSMEAADYPRPDLAIEIDLCPPRVDRPSIYKELGVFEVWRFVRGKELLIEQLQADGSYAPAQASRFLRVGPEDVLRWLADAANERPASWNRRLNEWAAGLKNQA